MRRPNVLVIMTDQHRADHLGCYGNVVVQTPHIDGLAARGTLFERCYVTSPSCMPNRASFMTVRMPSLHGVRQNGIPLPQRNRTFVEIMRMAGYRTALIGKSHLQNMQDLPPRLPAAVETQRQRLSGCEEAHKESLAEAWYEQELPSRWRDSTHRIDAPFYGFDHVELCDDHGDLAFGDYERWLRERLPDADRLRGPENASPAPDFVAPQAWRTRLPVELYPSSYVAERTEAYLAERAKDKQPFFVLCSFPDPHHPFTPPGHYWDMYDPADIALPPSFSHPAEHAPPHLAWLRRERTTGAAPLKSHRVFSVTERETREAIALTYGMITMVDDMVGRILKTLHDNALADHTVVIFTSDHGDLMGDHGLMLKGPLHYEGLIRVPLVVVDPQRPGRSCSDALCSTMDISETILDRAGLAGPNGTQGRSLLGILDGGNTAGRDGLIIEEETPRVFLGFDRPIRLRTLITPDDRRLSFYAGSGFAEIYDRRLDPHEFHNLWQRSDAQAQRTELVEQMASLVIELADRSPHPTRLA
jgi:arylsulfatase A-like enzyme